MHLALKGLDSGPSSGNDKPLRRATPGDPDDLVVLGCQAASGATATLRRLRVSYESASLFLLVRPYVVDPFDDRRVREFARERVPPDLAPLPGESAHFGYRQVQDMATIIMRIWNEVRAAFRESEAVAC